MHLYQFSICEVLWLEVRSRLWKWKRHPCGCLSAKAQSGSLVVSIYSATYKPSEPIRPGPKRMLWSQFQVFDAVSSLAWVRFCGLRFGHDCGKRKGTPWGVPWCKSPVGQRKGFYIFHHTADPQGPSGQVQSVCYGASFKFLMHSQSNIPKTRQPASWS